MDLQPTGQGAGDGGEGAADRPGDYRGNGPSHPHQLLRHAQLREPQDGRHQELVVGRPTGRKTLQRGLQIWGPGWKTPLGRKIKNTVVSQLGQFDWSFECNDWDCKLLLEEFLNCFYRIILHHFFVCFFHYTGFHELQETSAITAGWSRLSPEIITACVSKTVGLKFIPIPLLKKPGLVWCIPRDRAGGSLTLLIHVATLLILLSVFNVP